MKINKDLMDALLMLSFISLVLIATSDFANPMWKNILLSISGVMAVASITGRVMGAKTNKSEGEE